MTQQKKKKHEFSGSSLFIRFLFALIVVFASYNPSGYSYYHWAIEPLLVSMTDFSVLKAFIGVTLLIAWSILIRSTSRSLGILGIILAIAFFGLLLWLIIDVIAIIDTNLTVITYIIEFVIAAVLSAGVSWSHIRRRISGQLDVDDMDN